MNLVIGQEVKFKVNEGVQKCIVTDIHGIFIKRVTIHYNDINDKLIVVHRIRLGNIEL